jgi:hypothetical protein
VRCWVTQMFVSTFLIKCDNAIYSTVATRVNWASRSLPWLADRASQSRRSHKRSHRVHLADSHRYRRPSLLPTPRTTAWGDISKETVKSTSAGVEDRQHLTKIGLAGTRKNSYRFAMDSVRGGQRAASAGRKVTS